MTRQHANTETLGTLLRLCIETGVGREYSNRTDRAVWTRPDLAEHLGVDVRQLRRWVGDDTQISDQYFQGIITRLLGPNPRKHPLYERFINARITTKNLKSPISLTQTPTIFAKPLSISAENTVTMELDLWTPYSNGSVIDRAIKNHGAEISALSRDGISAIHNSDFDHMLDIGKQTIAHGKLLGHNALVAEGHYLSAEALRIKADFSNFSDTSLNLQENALHEYDNALKVLNSEPRYRRGYARTLEVMGRIEESIDIFAQVNFSMLELSTKKDAHPTPSQLHEQLRTLRHYVSSLASIQQTTIGGTLSFNTREDLIKSLVEKSINDHIITLPQFYHNNRWSYIEWFMADVLHAKSLIVVGSRVQAIHRLENAIINRGHLMKKDGYINEVESGNLHWWQRVAFQCVDAMLPHQKRCLEKMDSIILHKTPRKEVKEWINQFPSLPVDLLFNKN